MIQTIHLAGNGNLTAVDETGHIIPHLSVNLIDLWIKQVLAQGFDPDGIKIISPNQAFRIRRDNSADEYSIEIAV